MPSPQSARKGSGKRENALIRPKTVSSFLTKTLINNQTLIKNINDSYKQIPKASNVYRISTTKVSEFQDLADDVVRDHLKWCEEYEQSVSRQKKRCIEQFGVLNLKEQGLKRHLTPKRVTKSEASTLNGNLFIEQFKEFNAPKNNTFESEWEDLMLKVSKKREEEIKSEQSKQMVPYDKMIDKFQNKNKLNYSTRTLKEIQYCKEIKHLILRTNSSHTHLRHKNEKLSSSVKGIKASQTQPLRGLGKTSLMQSSSKIMSMCQKHNSMSQELKRNIQGFQIYCDRFHKVLQKKKNALVGVEN